MTQTPGSEPGQATFSEALAELSRRTEKFSIAHMYLPAPDSLPDFQAQVLDALQKRAPKPLATALKSAGNMHNPAMVALREHFNLAVMDTPTVRAYNDDLTPYGLRIDKASHEKLAFLRQDGKLVVLCFLWLHVTSLPPQ